MSELGDIQSIKALKGLKTLQNMLGVNVDIPLTPYVNPVTIDGKDVFVSTAYTIDTSAFVGQSITVEYKSYIGKTGLPNSRFSSLQNFLWDTTGTISNYNPAGSSTQIDAAHQSITTVPFADTTRYLVDRTATYTVAHPKLIIVFALYATDTTANASLASTMIPTINGASATVLEKGIGKTFGQNLRLDWFGNTAFSTTNSPTFPANNKNFWYGKTFNIIGDSITHGLTNYPNVGDVVANTFSDQAATSLGMTCNNYGINSSSIAVPPVDTTTNPMVTRYTSMADNADLVIVAGGTNDWQYTWTPLGDMTSRDNGTFYGALHNLCLGLMNKYQGKQLLFMTPIKRYQSPLNVTPTDTNGNGKTLEDYANIIKQVCGYYGIPVLDMFHECTLNPSISSQATAYFPDGATHPNQAGHNLMANRLIGYLKQLA